MKRLSANCKEFLVLSGYNVLKVQDLLKTSPTTFGIEKKQKNQAQGLGLDTNYPYVIFNPYNQPIV